MPLKLITPAIKIPISLSEAKAQLRIETAFTDDDDYIRSLINVAEAHVETYCNRRLITQTWEKTFQTWDEVEEKILFGGQLQEVVQITWLDEDGASDTLAASSYIVSGIGTDNGRIEFDNDADLATDLYQVDPISVCYTVGFFQGDAWIAETAYTLDDNVLANYGLIAQCIIAGTSGASAPAWPATIGATIVDGTATWEIIGQAVPDAIKQTILILISYYYENREPIKGVAQTSVDNLLLPWRIWDFSE